MIRFKLKELMAEKSFNDSQRVTFDMVAKATGIHRTTLTKIANKKGYNAKVEVVDKLCAYFNVGFDELMVRVEEKD